MEIDAMKKCTPSKKHRTGPLSLCPLKAEEALRLFMQVDPAKVEHGMKNLRRKNGQTRALPKV
jgi:hypothetical protein